jgi:hypothetical protein
MTWHADADELSAYRDRRLDAATTASVDAHLLGCATCREASRRLDDRAATDALWLDIVDEIDRRPQAGLERVLGRCGVPESLGRLLAATPGLLVATALAALVSTGFGLVLAGTHRSSQIAAFIALAAVVPAVGVAASFGAAADPAYEVGAAAPLSGLRLVLLRTVAVTLVAAGICLVGSLGHLDEVGLVAVGWLLPALGLAAATLALTTWVSPWVASGALVTGWLGAVALTGRIGHDWLDAFGGPTQVLAVVVLVVAFAVVAVRAPLLDHREV